VFKKIQRMIVVSAVVALLLSACLPEEFQAPADPEDIPATGIIPYIIVLNQEVIEGSVTIQEVATDLPGWVVIHADEAGAPGPIMGYTNIPPGIHRNIMVEIDPALIDVDILYARLHIDAGVPGQFEYPGPDRPVTVEGQILVEPFHIAGVLDRPSEPSVVAVLNTTFSPAELSVALGTTVVWTNEGAQPHTVASDEGIFESGVLEFGGTYEFTFHEPGEYPYHCQFHGSPGGEGMSGVIIVEDE
jgi:plastocyanin